jgi:hypothetical protein
MAVCWLAQGYATRHTQQAADGISYLEIAYQALAGNWHALLNSYWSPGYPIVLAVFLKIFDPSPAHELFMMRMVGWLTLIAALAAFEYFLRACSRFRLSLVVATGQEPPILRTNQFRMLADALFFWCTTVLVPSSNEHPDILVFLIFLLASAVAMDLLAGPRGYGRYLLFGAILGIGYIVKAVLFPLGFVFLVALALYRSQRTFKLILSAAIFLLICAPLVFGLSHTKGRFTIGDVGPVARAQTMSLYDFANLSPGTPVPAAPHIQIYSGGIWSGSYPAWTEPSIRFTGKVPHVPLRRQLNKTHIVLRFYFDMLATSLGALTCAVLILIFTQRDFVAFTANFFRATVLWMPALAGFAAYATLRAEGRFLPGFLMAFFAAICIALGPARIADGSKFTKYIVYAATIVLVAQAVVEAGHTASSASSGFPDWQLAATLPSFGVAAGDKVGFLGDALEDHVWAHLARVEIVGEIPKDDVLTYWAATTEEKQQALQELSGAGAKVLVAPNVPPSAWPEGWKQVAGTQYFILELPATRTTN